MKKLSTIVAAIMVALSCQAMALNQGTDTDEITPTELKSGNYRHKGLDFSIQTGGLMKVGDTPEYRSYVPIEFGLGKRFSKYVYSGLRTGVWITPEDDDTPNIWVPITAEARLYFPIKQSIVTPMINVGLTGALYPDNIDGEGLFSWEFMPGVSIPISKKANLNTSFGYMHVFNITARDNHNSNYLAIKIGINFHSKKK